MEYDINRKKIYKSSIDISDGFLDEHIYDEERHRQEEEERKNQERGMHVQKRITKKQMDYAAVKIAFVRIIAAGALFLMIYCIAEFKPPFIPFTINDIKEALKSNLFEFIK